MHNLLFVILLCCLSLESFADKKSFQGLFGSYRREKYIENEANSTDIGFNIMLSTLIPTTSIVKSNEGSEWRDLYYASFFNFEGELFFTINYHWHIYGSIGRYFYETRRENEKLDENSNPIFHQFEMEAIPILGGVKYRFTTDDIVPYIGIGSGIARVRRKAFYDTSSTNHESISNVVVGEFIGGFEFFISANVGIKLEMAAYYLALKEIHFDSGGTESIIPDFSFRPNLFSIRYASGIFVLF